ncbi:hypothetical protein ACIPXV_02680 [Streptomyces libani]|uniref:hypothetical protein n=1 Tax=Streptomyces nigrescens TaxID=1920 RepID=UPI003824106E
MDSRCGCGAALDLRVVEIDTATGPAITVTCCGPCARFPAGPPIPDGVARILARRAGVPSPGEPKRLRP